MTNKQKIVEWMENENGSEQGLIFAQKLEQIVKTEYKNCTYEQDFSIQCVDGLHRVIIDNKYILDIDYYTELKTIYENGVDNAVEIYFNKIKQMLN